ncbi:MAG TPA: glycosyltransferase family 4 protein [Candidatus Sulfotelmatobacter sp.]|jgi:glycosyltransferase involved in cell wall biosynthesis|nr:glycosyltransferase family 4 protein [Candidatus Sulfotelmatobacter sp.]
MKIGVFDPYFDDLGGGEKYMMMIASCLSEQHEVTVFWDKEEDRKVFQQRFNLPLEKVHIHKNIFSQDVSIFERIKTYREYDAFIILSDGSIPFVFPSKLYLHIQQPLPKRQKTLKDKIKLKFISSIFYNSEFTKHFNTSFFGGVKSTVIYPPVNINSRINSQDLKKENVIVHVGRFRVKNMAIEDYKKQGFMIDAFKKLIDQGLINWKFFLAASVKEEDKKSFAVLQKNAKGYPIEFHVNKSNHEIFDLYKKAKIYWHASGYGEDLEKYPELAEHFGMTTVEAMGTGTVPVVINNGGQKEIVKDGKNGLLWNTLEELLEQTKRLASDDSLWHELSQNAIIRAQDFSEEKFIHRVLTFII